MKLNLRKNLFGKSGLIGVALAAFGLLSSAASAGAADGFYVSGKKLMDANGKEFMMRGCNFSWAWQRGNESSVIPAAKRIGCNAIRIQLSTGSKWTKCSDSDLEKLIKLCIDNKLIVMFNTHDETGSNSYSDLENACNFWIEKKTILNKYRKYVLVNISNEWYGTWDASGWASGYKQAIPKLRNAGIKNTLVVDCAGYGQYPASIFNKGSEVAETDTEKNTIFSMHFYQDAAGSESTVESNINKAMQMSYPVIIGEFAYQHQGHSIAYQKILDMTKEKKMSTFIWSWTGNGGGAEDCDMFGSYDDSQWKTNGTKLVKGTNGVASTSVECSVFSSGTVTPDQTEDDDNSGTSSSSTVWTGDGDFNSWKSIVEIPESAFANAKEGDTVRLVFSNCGSTPQVQIAVKTVADWTWTELVSYDDIVNNQYDLKISGTPSGCDDTLLAMLKAHGMYLKGQDAHVAKVEILTSDGGNSGGNSGGSSESSSSTVWTGDGDFNNWTSIVEIPESAFTSAKEGDTVRLVFSNCGTTPQVQIAVKTVADWTWTELVSYDDITNSQYDLKIEGTPSGCDDTLLAMLKAHGMYLKGQDAHVAKVEILTSGGSSSGGNSGGSSSSSETTVWTGSEALGSWNNDVEIPASAFSSAAGGDTLRFNFTDCGENPQVQLVIKVGTDWTWTVLVEYDDITSNKYEYAIPSDTRADYSVISTLKERGMILKGQNATLTSVQVVKSGVSGIDEFKATDTRIDFNAPVEIYTLDGRRVDEMAKGIYILRQGNKVMKVIK